MPPSLDQFKMAAARLRAVDRYPYLASALFACPVLTHHHQGQLIIDRQWRIWADPAMVADLEVAPLSGRLVHLVSHVLRDHAIRADALSLGDDREIRRWETAADAEISDDFSEPGIIGDDPFPTAHPDDLDLPPGLLAEQYYHQLHSEPAALEYCDCGSGAHGLDSQSDSPAADDDSAESDDSSGVNPTRQKLIQRQVALDVSSAAPSSVSPRLRAWATSILDPVVDWRAELGSWLRRTYSHRAGMVDYSYRRPSRRASATPGVILAGLHAPAVEVALVCDTSASVSDHQLSQTLSELHSLTRSMGSNRISVLSCDEAVHQVDRFSFGSPPTLIGGGGTDMGVGIEVAMGLRPRPDVVVVITDGLTPWPPTAPRAELTVVLLEPAPPGMPPPNPPAWAKTIRVPAP